jgi:HAE1 family hydrophobic/amphiphilic exporter-1
VLRFDPASRAIWSLAVLPDPTAKGKAMNAVELTNWADQVLKKRLENVRGVGSVTLVGGTKREINIYLNPQALEALGITPDQVVAPCATRTRTCRWARSARCRAGTRGPDRRTHAAARGLRPDHRRTEGNGTAGARGPGRTVVDGAQEVDSLALYNGERTLLLTVQKSQDDNTIQVVDGLNKTLADMQPSCPRACAGAHHWTARARSACRWPTCASTLIEGALLTVLIVFLFLNSWRSTVITGLTLPIAMIGTFLFMNLFGFTINMITLMALSLCVGLLIDDAIVVRENIVRHVQMGKGALPGLAGRHAGNRPGRVGHHLVHRGGVPADRLHGRHHRQVLPRVWHHHRGGGDDLHVRQLHAGPDAVLHLARPQHRSPRPSPRTGYLLRQDHWPHHRLV